MSWTADHSSILIKPLGDQASGRLTDEHLEAAFLAAYEGRLYLDAGGWADKAKAYYAHAISRNPTSLLLHVRRITLYAQTADPAIIAALIDLYLALGKKGAALRGRMLAMARPLLSTGDYHVLRQQLEGQLSHPPYLQQRSAASVLCHGISGNTRLIEKAEATAPAEDDPLALANEQIAFGQIDLAQETLERALMNDSTHAELHHALIEIYRHAGTRQQALRMRRRLQDGVNPASDEWQRLIDELEEESQSK